MKRLLLLAFCPIVLLAQLGTYTVSQKDTLSGTASVVTVQILDTDSVRVGLESASIYCSVSCEFTAEINGTKATATTLTPAVTNAQDPASGIHAFRSSDVGAGTVLSRFVVPAGGTLTLDLRSVGLDRRSATQNFSIRTAAISGGAIINIKWKEY